MTENYEMQMKRSAGSTPELTFASRVNPVLYIGGPMHGTWLSPQKNSQLLPPWPELDEVCDERGEHHVYRLAHWDVATYDEGNDGKDEFMQVFFYRLKGTPSQLISKMLSRHINECTLMMLEQRDNGRLVHPMRAAVEMDRYWGELDKRIEGIALADKNRPSQRARIAMAESATFLEDRLRTLGRARVPRKLFSRGGI